MRLIALTSSRYTPLTEIYTKTLKLNDNDTFELKTFENKGDEDFGTYNYNLATKEMMRICWETLRVMEDGELFMYTDNDIVWNAPINSFTCGDDDIRFQQDCGVFNLCLGFFVCRVSPKIVKLFKDIYEHTTGETNCQIAINQVITPDIKYSFFEPSDIIGYGLISNDHLWNGEEFEIPECKAFHANYTIGIPNKLLLMQKALCKFQAKN